MTVSIYASRYAKALFRMALENKELARWQSDLRKADDLLKDAALSNLLTNPKIAWGEKVKTLQQRLGEGNTPLMKLFMFLNDKNRLAMISEIDEEFQRLVDNHRGVEGAETADITTAIELDNEYQLKLAQRLTEIIGKPVILKTKVDPAIIGGIIIQVKDKLIDGSLRSKLAALRSELGGVAK
jgi:F-type H+-transporting ATPase subunit delta